MRLTRAEASEHLGISLRTLDRRISAGTVESVIEENHRIVLMPDPASPIPDPLGPAPRPDAEDIDLYRRRRIEALEEQVGLLHAALAEARQARADTQRTVDRLTAALPAASTPGRRSWISRVWARWGQRGRDNGH